MKMGWKTINVRKMRRLTDEDLRVLIKTFADRCIDCNCSQCRYYCLFDGVSGVGKCLDEYLEDIREDKIKPEDSFEEKAGKKANRKKALKED